MSTDKSVHVNIELLECFKAKYFVHYNYIVLLMQINYYTTIS